MEASATSMSDQEAYLAKHGVLRGSGRLADYERAKELCGLGRAPYDSQTKLESHRRKLAAVRSYIFGDRAA